MKHAISALTSCGFALALACAADADLVEGVGAAAPGVVGGYNNNGMVSHADYAVWQ